MSRVLEQRLEKVLKLRNESESIIVSLVEINSHLEKEKKEGSCYFYDQNDGTNSQKFGWMKTLEAEDFEICADYLKGFGNVHHTLEKMDSKVNQMERGCESIYGQIDSSYSSMETFLERLHGLQLEQQNLSKRAEKVEKFIKKYQLSEEEKANLNLSHKENLDESFFKTFHRLKEVCESCAFLVEKKGIGFDLLDSLSNQLDFSYEQIYNWIQKKCGDQSFVEDLQTDSFFILAVKALKDRPAFFDHCKETIVLVRQKAVVKIFANEMVNSGHQNENIAKSQKFADFLSWTHQMLVSEKDLLSSLFDKSLELESKGKYENECASSASKDPLVTVSNEISAPLFAQLSNIYDSSDDPIELFKQLGFTIFYSEKVGCLLNEESELSGTLNSIIENIHSLLHQKLKQPRKAQNTLESFLNDLSPPNYLIEAAKNSKNLILASAQLPYNDQLPKRCDLAPLVNLLLDPALDSCIKISESLDSLDAAIFMINCIHMVKETLLGLSSNGKKFDQSNIGQMWTERLSEDLEGWAIALRGLFCRKIMEETEMDGVLKAVENRNKSEQLIANLKKMNANDLKVVFQNFHTTLFSLNFDRFEKIESFEIKEHLRHLSVQHLSKEYRNVYETLSDKEASGFDDTSFMFHTPEEVSIILDCDT